MSQGVDEGSARGRQRCPLALVAFILANCGGSSVVVTAAGSDGVYELRCETSLPRCLEQVDSVCRGSRYAVIHATDDRAYRGSLGTFESETRSSSASVRCLARGRVILERSDHQQPTSSSTGGAPQSHRFVIRHNAAVGILQTSVGSLLGSGGSASIVEDSP